MHKRDATVFWLSVSGNDNKCFSNAPKIYGLKSSRRQAVRDMHKSHLFRGLCFLT